jgi:hypothetical protein
MTLELVVDTRPVPELGVSGGYAAVAMSAVRAIPVLEAPPGVVLPQIFGATAGGRRSLHPGVQAEVKKASILGRAGRLERLHRSS